MHQTAALDTRLVQHYLSLGRVREAAISVELAVDAGDIDATYLLATWLLVGQPVERDLERCRALLRRAARGGHLAARHMEVALTANGSGAAPDWPGALALLRDLARDDPHAARQLALIEAMALDPEGAPLEVRPVEALCDTPRTAVVRAFLTPDECEHVIRTARPLLQPALIIDEATGRTMRHPVRTSHIATLGPPQEDLVIQAILKRIAAATGTAIEQGESAYVLRYEPGEEFRQHLDTIPGGANQRAITALIYLNDAFTEGKTLFNETGFLFQGAPGDMLFFYNVTPDGRIDPLSRHAGLPVGEGVKWICTRWIRERAYSAFAPD